MNKVAEGPGIESIPKVVKARLGTQAVPELLTCPKCRQDKAPSEFGRSKARSTGRQLWCRACKATYDQGSLPRQPRQETCDSGQQQGQSDRKRKRAFLYLLAHPCQDCGEKDPVVLEFDHVSGEKSSAITDMVRGGAYRWDTIAAEIEKCVVRCANCHRRRTAIQLGFRTWRDLQEPVVGIEPTTPSLRVRCSTSELHRQCTPIEALHKHFGLAEDRTFRNQTAIKEFLARGTSNREPYP
jgi:uncharacterized protein YbaR (Trm112 family)